MKDLINKCLNIFGVEIHGAGYIQKIMRSDYKKNEWKTQQKLLGKKASVIFDVGANRGNTVSKYLSLFPSVKIHAFEPFPDIYKTLMNHHKNNTSVYLNKYALSSKVGRSTFYVNKSIDTNSLLKSKKIGASSDKNCISINEIVVNTNTIDNYCLENNIYEIDILKIDVQGSELEVLKGSLNMLKSSKIKIIYIETYFKQQYINQPLFHDISKLLYNYNFTLQDIYDPYFSKKNILWCDAIFINSNEIK